MEKILTPYAPGTLVQVPALLQASVTFRVHDNLISVMFYASDTVIAPVGLAQPAVKLLQIIVILRVHVQFGTV